MMFYIFIVAKAAIGSSFLTKKKFNKGAKKNRKNNDENK